MQLRSGRTKRNQSRGHWNDLPVEIRLMILEWLSTGHDSIPHPLASYATTSEEWRVFFEQKTFRRLRVLPTCLDEFDRIVTGRRRPYVRHIWFRIELKSRGHGQSSKFLSEVNKMTLTAGLLHLFEILADWLEGESNQKGLALELSAFSSIDPDHSMKDAVPRDIEDLDVWTDSDRSSAIYEGLLTCRRSELSLSSVFAARLITPCLWLHLETLPKSYLVFDI
ncbi:hypothetical protein QBC33DRAFT_513356 [Phialemonium atrogriseum]|uniref:F-box domain-containing protein n=1 Tax=Phialemonium atrogriseum TaxID=1093897 RepID=A0AAJ0C7H9_9PEZI|nr:uncharacterized protein QBC33DRAFT_513356 [Phialemonium atrogriseum]KAK1769116.1 hypothetical protein QBC33DRAFT_513356 [Phialemonium atrogriseum]